MKGAMKTEQIRNRLIQAARAARPSEAVPLAFSARIMARIKSPSAPDAWILWGRWLWQAAAPCVAIMVCLSIWVWCTGSPESPVTDGASLDLVYSDLAPFSLDENW